MIWGKKPYFRKPPVRVPGGSCFFFGVLKHPEASNGAHEEFERTAEKGGNATGGGRFHAKLHPSPKTGVKLNWHILG